MICKCAWEKRSYLKNMILNKHETLPSYYGMALHFKMFFLTCKHCFALIQGAKNYYWVIKISKYNNK